MTLGYSALARLTRLAALCALVVVSSALPALAQSVTNWTAPGVTVMPGAAPQPAVTSGQAKIDGGYSHTCALTSVGGVKCWGRNKFGELGDGTTANHLTPIAVVGLSSGVVAIAAGTGHTCALTSAGAVKCWGGNTFGQLGDGTMSNRVTPSDVVGLSSGVVAIAAGSSHTCALTSAGAVKCWGGNKFGQLGDGTFTAKLAPVGVVGLSNDVVALAARGGHSCVLTTAGAVKCWGSNSDGQCGNGTTINWPVPVPVSGLANGVVGIAAGWRHSCAMTAAGGVKCWGRNRSGQLGDGTITDRLTPVAVRSLASGVIAIAAAYSHSCVVTSAGRVKCWGQNFSGQLGDGTTTNRLTPVGVIGF